MQRKIKDGMLGHSVCSTTQFMNLSLRDHHYRRWVRMITKKGQGICFETVFSRYDREAIPIIS